MISTGDPSEFAIQCEFTSVEQEWLYGRFRFVFRNECCGNWNDEVDLRACVSWLRDFAENPQNRYEAGLLTAPANEIFDRLVKPVLRNVSVDRPADVYDNTYSRFHISHLGMSSFDAVTMILVEDDQEQRCLWTVGSSTKIHDYRFKSGLLQSTASRFCDLLKKEVSDFGVSL
jgi:hypothetical protein